MNQQVKVKHELDLTVWGYIPGSHLFYCSDCMRSALVDGNWPHKGNSRSTRCVQHAMDARLADLRSQEGELIAELGRNPIEQAILEHDIRMGNALRTITISAILSVTLIIAVIYAT